MSLCLKPSVTERIVLEIPPSPLPTRVVVKAYRDDMGRFRLAFDTPVSVVISREKLTAKENKA